MLNNESSSVVTTDAQDASAVFRVPGTTVAETARHDAVQLSPAESATADQLLAEAFDPREAYRQMTGEIDGDGRLDLTEDPDPEQAPWMQEADAYKPSDTLAEISQEASDRAASTASYRERSTAEVRVSPEIAHQYIAAAGIAIIGERDMLARESRTAVTSRDDVRLAA